MSNINERYYKGFEEDSEIIFRLEDDNKEYKAFGIWEGYLENIIEKVKPVNGYWTGLAYYYHLDIGWYEESPWQVENLKEAYEQLAEIDFDSLEYPEEMEILKIILDMFREAIENNYKLYISYE